MQMYHLSQHQSKRTILHDTVTVQGANDKRRNARVDHTITDVLSPVPLSQKTATVAVFCNALFGDKLSSPKSATIVASVDRLYNNTTAVSNSKVNRIIRFIIALQTLLSLVDVELKIALHNQIKFISFI